MTSIRLLVASVSWLGFCHVPCTAEDADLVLRGGTVVTVDTQYPKAEAIAVRGDLISAVGTNAEIDQLVGDGTRVIELKGAWRSPDSSRGMDISRASVTRR